MPVILNILRHTDRSFAPLKPLALVCVYRQRSGTAAPALHRPVRPHREIQACEFRPHGQTATTATRPSSRLSRNAVRPKDSSTACNLILLGSWQGVKRLASLSWPSASDAGGAVATAIP